MTESKATVSEMRNELAHGLRKLQQPSVTSSNEEIVNFYSIIAEKAVPKLPKKDVQEIQKSVDTLLKEQSVEDKKSDRKLKVSWGLLVLGLLYVTVLLNFFALLGYGFGILQFPDPGVIKLFLGGSIATVPVISITITNSLFKNEKDDA